MAPSHHHPVHDPLWYKDAVIYEVPIKSYYDSNGDGIGDLPGLIQKLDYIQSLGVTCIWLLPFYPSPLKDDGYDVADYRRIHPSYGSMRDFKHLVREVHKRDMRIIIELIVNHTSDQHPWFQAARQAPKGSSKRDFYVWSDSDQKYSEARIIFTDTETSNWAWDPVAQQYYWHRFFSHQPDLNFENPKVIRLIERVMQFWLNLGVDGFRLDAIPYLIEREETNCENLPETHTIIKQWRQLIDEKYPGRLLLAEANQWPEDVRAYFGDGDECHMAYHFPIMPRLFMALHQENSRPISDILALTPDIPDNCQWAMFLRNHDELTLEMVTDEERDYMYKAYVKHPIMRCNIGIRRRLTPLVENSRRRLELLYSLLFSLPGTPILYYGDEIGMGDNVYLGDRNGVRTPMQWNADRNAGFSRSDFAQLYSPPIMDAIYNYQSINVENANRDTSSLLNWLRHIIQVRKLYRAFGRGDIQVLKPKNHKIFAFIRRYETEILLITCNLSAHCQPAELDLSEYNGFRPMEIIGSRSFPTIQKDHDYFLSFGPHAFYWFRLVPTWEHPS